MGRGPGLKSEPVEDPEDESEEFQLADTPGFLFRRLDSLATYLFYQRSGQTVLSPRQFGILLTLHETGPIGQGELSDLMHIDRSTMGEIIRRMADRGLIRRRTPVEDRRRLELSLTRAGAKALRDVFDAAVRVQEEIIGAIPDDERDLVLRRLKAILDKFGF